MLILPIDKRAVLPSHKLKVLAHYSPLPEPIPTPEPSPDREECNLDMTLTTARLISKVAIHVLSLPSNTPILESIPLLLEAIHHSLVHFPALDETTEPLYYISEEAFRTLIPYTSATLTDIIFNTPVPTEPIIFKSDPRTTAFRANLTPDLIAHLQEIAKLLITPSGGPKLESIGLEYVAHQLMNIDTTDEQRGWKRLELKSPA